MNLAKNPSARPARQLGFSMVEILVGVMIGMIGVAVIMQVFSQSEGSRRSAGGVADAQTNGLLGLFNIERDLQQAGLGLVNTTLLNCNVRSSLPFNNKPLLPAAIIPDGAAATSADNLWNIPPGDAGSDMIAVVYTTTASMVEGTTLLSAPAGNVYQPTVRFGLSTNDYMVVGESGKDCTLGRITSINVAANTVTLDYGGVVTYSSSAYLYHLGATPRVAVYAVRNGVLTVCDYWANDCAAADLTGDSTVWVPVTDGVVALVGQYGWDTTNPPNMAVDTYCKAHVAKGATCPTTDTGSPAPTAATGETAAQQICDWTRIPALRLAVVVRASQYEKDEVSAASIKLWPNSTVAPTTVGPSYAPADRHYRYRVFSTVIPMRNVIWLGAQSSC